MSKDNQQGFLRFPRSYRIEHWILFASFTTLAITGLVQKFATAGISQFLVGLVGGPENTRIIHRTAAIVLMLETVYHIGIVGYRLFVKRSRLTMLPTLNDVRNAWDAFRFNLGLKKNKPQQGRFTFEEKLEYWAVVWGTLVMAITGFMLWNPIATTRFISGQWVPAAKAAHGGEALLAVLAIIVWHMYHVHLRRFNRSIFTGRLSEEEMLDEHPIELADAKAGISYSAADSPQLEKRKRGFLAGYSVLAAAMLVGIYWFATFEETAIDTIPPLEEGVTVFAPLTPTPLPTPAPTQEPPSLEATTWTGGIADLFEQKCGACHGSGTALGGLDITTYQSLLTGGASGPGVVPGDPDSSMIIVRQSTGDHPGQLTGDELALIREWIENGAPEE
ncbi:MAG: cytochrome b/b6 domain-containing protein [Anaerolineales bacterium]|jgi:cytochrome b subunit of formate dehydrogenase